MWNDPSASSDESAGSSYLILLLCNYVCTVSLDDSTAWDLDESSWDINLQSVSRVIAHGLVTYVKTLLQMLLLPFETSISYFILAASQCLFYKVGTIAFYVH